MLKHKHLLVRAEVLDPPKDLKSTKLWLKKINKRYRHEDTWWSISKVL